MVEAARLVGGVPRHGSRQAHVRCGGSLIEDRPRTAAEPGSRSLAEAAKVVLTFGSLKYYGVAKCIEGGYANIAPLGRAFLV